MGKTNTRHRSDSRSDTQQVLDSFRRIVQRLRVASRAAEQTLGLSAAQLFVLNKLADGKTASLNELAERTLTHQSTVSVVVQRLVERNFVQRCKSAQDGRQIVLTLTPQGRASLRKSPQAAQEELIDAIDALPASKRRELSKILSVVADKVAPSEQLPPMLFSEEGDRKAK